VARKEKKSPEKERGCTTFGRQRRYVVSWGAYGLFNGKLRNSREECTRGGGEHIKDVKFKAILNELSQ